MSRHLITAALPYANGPIHIGHLLEYIQADIHARFLRLLNHDILFVCASDMHGSPIEINAQKAGVSPEQFVEKYYKEHQQTFKAFQISFDHYYKTHSEENKQLSIYFFNELKKKGHIYLKSIKIIYCDNCKRSLPDRYVKGECPKCHAQDQYGDICEKCSTVLKGTDLVNPYCSLCKHPPIQKDSLHYFFKLSSFQSDLKLWINTKNSKIQLEIKNGLVEWLEKRLDDWCISRDSPYFGFEIPHSQEETGDKKYFYVWLDAPIGYISATKHHLDNQNSTQQSTPASWQDYWKHGQVHHHIGKDIIYFHFLFWAAMLTAMEIPLPHITVHSFLTVDGQKMSKSRGTFFTADDFQKIFPIESLRFYFATHLDTSLVDIDLNFANLQAVNNNVLLGNLANFCYRTLTFAHKNYPKIDHIGVPKMEQLQVDVLLAEIKNNYAHLDYKSATKNILRLSDIGNILFQKATPWKTKDDPHTKAIVGFCVNLARNLGIVSSPIIPFISQKIYASTQENNLKWSDISFSWKGELKEPQMLAQKIETIPEEKSCTLLLLVGTVTKVKDHPNAERLFLLQANFGTEANPETKQVVSGLKGLGITKDQILHKNILFILNLKPSNIRGEKSYAMMLTAEEPKRSDEKEGKIIPLYTEAPAGTAAEFQGYIHKNSEILPADFAKFNLKIENHKILFEGKILHISGKEFIVKDVNTGKVS